MSRYGDLWQECSDIRMQLRSISPFIQTDNLEQAMQSSASVVSRVTTLLERWRDLEEQMSKEPE